MALRSTDDTAGRATAAAGRPTVAAFDFDGTLTDGGASFPFLVSLRGVWPVLRAVVALSPGLLRAALTGGTAADEVKEKLFTRLLGGLPVDEVDRRSVVFAHRHLQRHLRADTRRAARVAPRQGHHTVIVSASPECYVSPAGRGAGGRRGRGHPARRRRRRAAHRRLRGEELPGGREVRPAGRPPPRRGLLSNNGGEQPVLWAYGNSRGDLRLLNAADHGVDAGRLGSARTPAPFPPALRGRRSGRTGSARGDGDADGVP